MATEITVTDLLPILNTKFNISSYLKSWSKASNIMILKSYNFNNILLINKLTRCSINAYNIVTDKPEKTTSD